VYYNSYNYSKVFALSPDFMRAIKVDFDDPHNILLYFFSNTGLFSVFILLFLFFFIFLRKDFILLKKVRLGFLEKKYILIFVIIFWSAIFRSLFEPAFTLQFYLIIFFK